MLILQMDYHAVLIAYIVYVRGDVEKYIASPEPIHVAMSISAHITYYIACITYHRVGVVWLAQAPRKGRC